MEKVAVIDLGSNSVRMIIFKVLQEGCFVVADEIKETVKLGQDMERDGYLKPTRIAQAIKVLRMFRKLCDAQKVDKIIAVGTNVIRRAKNQKSFLEEIYTTCNLKLKILSAEEEAFHIYQAVINTLEISKGLIFDISGSSTQLIYYNRRSIIHQENLQFGALTLTDLFMGGEPKSAEEFAKMVEEFAQAQFESIGWLKEIEPDINIVGVGGSFRNLGKISRRVLKYPLDTTHNYVLSSENFLSIYDSIRVLDADKRIKIKGLSTGRADTISSAFSIMKGLHNVLNFGSVTISGSGLREGIMFNHAMPVTNDRPIMDILGYSINTMLANFEENREHAEHVYNLSVQLFKQLRVMHKLPRQYLRVLRASAYLHDCGMRIKYYDHHKHSAYIIMNSGLPGLSHREIVLSAFVASQHRKEEFSMQDWLKYKSIVNEEDLTAVLKLGVILRIAESLDRSMSGLIKSLNCDVLGDSVIMKTTAEGDCTLEIKDAMAAAPEFARAYKKNLEIL